MRRWAEEAVLKRAALWLVATAALTMVASGPAGAGHLDGGSGHGGGGDKSSVIALVVVDALGEIVGPLVDAAEPFASVLFRLEDERIVVIGVERDRLLGPYETIGFDDVDCLGQAYIAMNDPPTFPVVLSDLFPGATVGPPGATLYVAAPDATPQFAEIQSAFDSRLIVECNTPIFAPRSDWLPIEPVKVLDFQPPFSVQ